MDICTTFHGDPSYSCWDISLKTPTSWWHWGEGRIRKPNSTGFILSGARFRQNVDWIHPLVIEIFSPHQSGGAAGPHRHPWGRIACVAQTKLTARAYTCTQTCAASYARHLPFTTFTPKPQTHTPTRAPNQTTNCKITSSQSQNQPQWLQRPQHNSRVRPVQSSSVPQCVHTYTDISRAQIQLFSIVIDLLRLHSSIKKLFYICSHYHLLAFPLCVLNIRFTGLKTSLSDKSFPNNSVVYFINRCVS